MEIDDGTQLMQELTALYDKVPSLKHELQETLEMLMTKIRFAVSALGEKDSLQVSQQEIKDITADINAIKEAIRYITIDNQALKDVLNNLATDTQALKEKMIPTQEVPEKPF